MSATTLNAAFFRSHKSKQGTVGDLENIFHWEPAKDLPELYLSTKEKYENAKAELPAFAVSTTLTTRARQNGDNCARQHTGLVAIDIDGFTSKKNARFVRDNLQNCIGCVTAFLSPSHHGVKGIFRVDPIPTTAEEHTQAWREVKEMIEEDLEGTTVDDSGKDVTRLTYCSYDPNADYDVDVEPIKGWLQRTMPAYERSYSEVHTLSGEKRIGGSTTFPDNPYHQRHLAAWESPMSRWQALTRAACDFWVNWPHLSEDQIVIVLNEWAGRTGAFKYQGAEIERLMGDTKVNYVRGEPWKPEQNEWVERDDDDAPKVLLSAPSDKRGIVAEVLDDMTISIRYNERACRLEYSYLIGGIWIPFTEGWFHELRADIIGNYRAMRSNGPGKQNYAAPIGISEQDLHSALKALGNKNNVDPFEDWLHEKVAETKWDGTPRLERVLIDLFGAEDTPLNRWAARYLFIAVIQRTLEPGCKLHEIPVWIGPQGIGKSQTCRQIFPPDYQDEWFSDDFNMSRNDQRVFESTRGFALVEMSEMAGFAPKEIEATKRYITSQTDHQRLPYARTSEAFPRRFVFVATTNNDTPLPNDASGNRRYVPVRLQHGSNIEMFMNDNREQLWAEAWHMWENGTRANLPRNLFTLQQEAAEGARNADHLVEELVAQLPVDEPMLLTEICEELKLIHAQEDDSNFKFTYKVMPFPEVTRIKNALANAGWTTPTRRTMWNGKRGLWWWPPRNE